MTALRATDEVVCTATQSESQPSSAIAPASSMLCKMVSETSPRRMHEFNLDTVPEEKQLHNPDYKLRNQNRKSFQPSAILVMKSWLMQHVKYPYPTEEEKLEMELEAGLSLVQINNWFINARRRILHPLLSKLDVATAIDPALDIQI